MRAHPLTDCTMECRPGFQSFGELREWALTIATARRRAAEDPLPVRNDLDDHHRGLEQFVLGDGQGATRA